MEFLKSFWDKTKAFFSYSETVLLARLQVIAGFILAVLGGIDWTALSDFTSYKQTMWLSIGLVANGVLTELIRRRNASA